MGRGRGRRNFEAGGLFEGMEVVAEGDASSVGYY
jgi:hypothetical protein